MRRVTTKEIARWIGGEVSGDALISGVAVDNRSIKLGELFVCLRGEKVDGHTFAAKAIEAGAAGLLVDRYLDLDIPQILVSDTLKGLVDIAKYYRNTLNATFISISGSNGKTSSKDMLRSVLSLVSPTVATLENQNTEIGACLNLFRMDDATRFGVFEMGLDDPGDIKKMTDIIRADYAILTSLDQAHMDNFETMENLAKEKFKLFDGMDPEHCFYNGDYPLYKMLSAGHKSFGVSEFNDIVVSSIYVNTDSVSFTVDDSRYTTNLVGAHQASNACGCISVLKAIGISDVLIKQGLESVVLTKMRTEIFNKDHATILFDAYKSSPESAKAALDVAGVYTFEGPKYVVMADMYMLGEGSDLRHIEVLNHALKYPFMKLYLFGEEFMNASHFVQDERIVCYDDFDKFKKDVSRHYSEVCFMVFKGSRYFELERLLEDEVSHD